MTGDSRTFVVTGCASGIGRHVANALVLQGQRMLAADINLKALEENARVQGWPGDRVLLQELDVRDSESWEEALQSAVSQFGGIDVLMNIAGYLEPGWAHEMKSEDVDRHFDINAKGVIFGTQAAARIMIPQKRGHIINMGSMSALAPIPGLALYSASKYAVRAFSLAVAQELRPYGIYVTVVCPDAVSTPMLELQKRYKQAALTFSGPRILSVEDVGQLILGPVLSRKPLEIFLPKSRGWLARVADLFPQLGFLLGPAFQKKGLKRQASLKV
ncbi:MAG: SDR family oxidoreductase [Elusimicrobia bacterium]|nr:SDR family oxidoreductase [Elusimicrobiota bacterium]